MTTINKEEIQKFSNLADEWWDVKGKFKPLHMFNPIRIEYILDEISKHFKTSSKKNCLNNFEILDIGCGGGLMSEPMARLGATVVGVDAAERNIPVAQAHANRSNLSIDYRVGTAEELVGSENRFDVILNMEVIEHVADPLSYLSACRQLLVKGGLMICSTINRNPKSFAMAIIGAEYVMRWLPKGTHEWSKFIKPDELYQLISKSGLTPVDKKGFVFNPIKWSWALSDRDLSVNYVTASLNEDEN